jgi:SAM-dependent methyltransferase
VIFTIVIVLVTLSLLLFLLSMIWPPDSPWSPWWRTNGKVARAMIRLADITKSDIIYDLGCGDGTVLLTAAKMKGTRGVGLEIDPSRVLIAKVRFILGGVNSLVKVKRKDLFSEDLSRASVIVVYLVPKTLKRLESKFISELKPGTKVISYVYPIDYLPLIGRDEARQINFYEIPKKFSRKKH